MENPMGTLGIGIVCTLCIPVALRNLISCVYRYELVAEWGSSGSEDGHFLEPYGIAIDGDSNLFISDP